MKKPELTQKELLDIARQQNINVPIMSYRVVGDRVELFLYGGAIVQHPGDGPILALDDLDTKQLRYLATQLDIPGRSKMKRAQLIKALAEAEPEQLDQAIGTLND